MKIKTLSPIASSGDLLSSHCRKHDGFSAHHSEGFGSANDPAALPVGRPEPLLSRVSAPPPLGAGPSRAAWGLGGCALGIALASLLPLQALVAQPARTTHTRTTNSCQFDYAAGVMSLKGSCTTSTTVYVPDGYTLDGQGYTVTAVNPSTGPFQGAIIQNAGPEAHIANLLVNASGVSDVCQQGDARLKGIWLYKATGSVVNTQVWGINRGSSVCEEGNAIDISNPPYDGTHPGTVSVTLTGNRVWDYQKTGIAVSGDVQASVSGNTVGRAAALVGVAANGIQLGYGAQGELSDNDMAGNEFDLVTNPQRFATGALIYQASRVRMREALVSGPDIDIGIAIFESSAVMISSSQLSRTVSADDALDEFGIGLWFSGNSGIVRQGRNTLEGWNDAVRFDSSAAMTVSEAVSPFRP